MFINERAVIELNTNNESVLNAKQHSLDTQPEINYEDMLVVFFISELVYVYHRITI
jgi:hypothetical protein